MADLQARIEAARGELQQLEQQLRGAIDQRKDKNLKDVSSGLPAMSNPGLSCKRTLKGHMGKVYSMHWSGSGTELVSCAQDGVLIVWDGLSANKLHAVPLACSWVMTCGMAPSGEFVASGGLDNICSVFNLSQLDSNNSTPSAELTGHNGHLSSCRFVNNQQILTSSGDKTSILWDVQTGNEITKFAGHSGDVLSVSIAPDSNTFVSGSVDNTSKLFDFRTGELAQMRFVDHVNDVNAVQFFPNGQAFGTGSEDGTCKIYDTRYAGSLASFDVENGGGVTSVAFSSEGRYFFSSYSQGSNVKVWDTFKGNQLTELKGHKDRVSSIGVSSDGKAVGTACWDRFLKIYA